jgi:hypothetical protein
MGRGSATYGDHAATPPAGMYRWQVKFLFEAGGERAIVDGAANLEQKIGSTSRRAHLLRLVHPAVHQKIGRLLGDRGSTAASAAVRPPRRPLLLPSPVPDHRLTGRWRFTSGAGVSWRWGASRAGAPRRRRHRQECAGTNAPDPRVAIRLRRTKWQGLLGATVGEGGEHRVLGAPDRVDAPTDQHFDVRIGFGM